MSRRRHGRRLFCSTSGHLVQVAFLCCWKRPGIISAEAGRLSVRYPGEGCLIVTQVTERSRKEESLERDARRKNDSAPVVRGGSCSRSSADPSIERTLSNFTRYRACSSFGGRTIPPCRSTPCTQPPTPSEQPRSSCITRFSRGAIAIIAWALTRPAHTCSHSLFVFFPKGDRTSCLIACTFSSSLVEFPIITL